MLDNNSKSLVRKGAPSDTFAYYWRSKTISGQNNLISNRRPFAVLFEDSRYLRREYSVKSGEQVNSSLSCLF